MTGLIHLTNDLGLEVQADMALEIIGGHPCVTLESRSGALGTDRARNTEYNEGLELVLKRLADQSWSVLEITLESMGARDLPIGERRLPLDWPLVLRPGIDERQLRLLIGNGQRAVAASPTKTPGTGNANRRIRLLVGGPETIADLAAALGATLSPRTRDDRDTPGQPQGHQGPDLGESQSAPAVTREASIVAWQEPGSVKLPKVLRRAIVGPVIPSALVMALTLEDSTSWDQTFSQSSAPVDTLALGNAFLNLLQRCDLTTPLLDDREVSIVKGMPASELVRLFDRISIGLRAKNILMGRFDGADGALLGLARATLGDVALLKGFGATCFFELATGLEQVLAVGRDEVRGGPLDPAGGMPLPAVSMTRRGVSEGRDGPSCDIGPAALESHDNLSTGEGALSIIVPWQQPGSLVLPRLLKRFRSICPVPDALTSALHLEGAAVWESRFSQSWPQVDGLRLSNAFTDLVNRGNLNVPLLDDREAATLAGLRHSQLDLVFHALPLRLRTRNVLLREYGEAAKVLPALARATVGQIMDLRNFGAVSFFDLTTCLDQALPAGSLDGIQGRGPSDEADTSPQGESRGPALMGAGLRELDGGLPKGSSDGGQQAGRRSARMIVAWQDPGSIALPAVLARCLKGRPAPSALMSALNVDERAPWTSRFLESHHPVDSMQLNNAFSECVAACDLGTPLLTESQCATVRGLLDHELAAGFDLLPLRRRTSNALLRRFGGPKDVLPALARATVGDMLRLAHFGPVSFLELTTCLDQLFNMDEFMPVGAGLRQPSVEPPEELEPPEMPEFAQLIHEDDPRFGDLLNASADLREHIEWSRDDPGRWPHAEAVIREVAERRERRSGMFVEEEAEDILVSALGATQGRWVDVFKRRYGLDEKDPGTLDEASALAGVTRERVRQVQTRVESRLPRLPAWAPAIEQAIDLLNISTPATAADLTSALRAADLTGRKSWSAAQLVSVARLAGRRLDLSEDGVWIGTDSELAAVKKILVAARKASGFLGVATVDQVIARLRWANEEGLEDSLVQAVLSRDPAARYVNESHFWTDHADGRNRLVNVSQRILTAMQPQTLEDMLEGVTRHYSWRASTGGDRFKSLHPPDAPALRAFYKSHPAFSVLADGRITLCSSPTDDSLGSETLALVGVLRAQVGMAMDRNSLIAACVETGMAASTAGVLITYSECVKRFGANVWGLRGAAPSEDEVARLQAGAKLRAREVDGTRVAGRTPSGRAWFARRVTQTFLYSGVMSNDWEKNLLNGKSIELVDGADGEPVGQLRFADAFNYGYTAFLRRNEVRVGDVMRVTVDLVQDSCIAELGGEELLSAPFDW